MITSATQPKRDTRIPLQNVDMGDTTTTTTTTAPPQALFDALQSMNHEDALIKTTSLREHHIEMLLTILRIRAAAFARVANFDQALDEASLHIQIAPFCALGYMQSGEILSNMQGYQTAAIKVYEKGLSMVPQSDPSHQQLIRAKQQAREKQQIRVDFISQLPLAIVRDCIAPLLRGDGRSKWSSLGTVSKRWHQALMAGNMDKKHFKIHGSDTLDEQQRLMDAAPEVVSLRFKNSLQPPHTLLNPGKFHSLQKLSIEGCFLSSWPEFAAALNKVGRWLTHLELENVGGAPIIPLTDVLESCPRLKSMRCLGGRNVVDISTIEKQCITLTCLQFWANDQIRKEHVVELLSRIPSLEQLSIYDKTTSECLIKLDTAYDHVFSARFNHLISNFDSIPTTTATTNGGKRMLCIHGQGLKNSEAASKLLLESHRWPSMGSFVYNISFLDSTTIFEILRSPSPVLRLEQSLNSLIITRCGLKEGHLMQIFQQWRSEKRRLDQLRLIEEPGMTDRVVASLAGRGGAMICRRLELNRLPHITRDGIKFLYSRLYPQNIKIVECPMV